MSLLYNILQPFISRIDPEIAHGFAIFALKRGLVSDCPLSQNPRLEQTIWNLEFKNPVGLAAGFDKNAEVASAMLSQGFGFVEAGTVTPKAQPGNPKPRVFRYGKERAVINRLGFNSAGIEAVLNNLPSRSQRTGPVGINLGKNRNSHDAVADYVSGVHAFADQADFLVVNVSSPNTPGLRELQSRNNLEILLDAVQSALSTVAPNNPPPLLLKVAPDLDEGSKRDIAKVALDMKLDGLVATNTTIGRPVELLGSHSNEAGGLSGAPLLNNSTGILSDFYRLCEGRVPLIGVGGVTSGADAYSKIRAGASLVQLYTALIFEGPSLIRRINDDLSLLLEQDGYTNISDAVGADH
jgi:dihydroorotate dehydrogenase